jgi:hypothetical protein
VPAARLTPKGRVLHPGDARPNSAERVPRLPITSHVRSVDPLEGENVMLNRLGLMLALGVTASAAAGSGLSVGEHEARAAEYRERAQQVRSRGGAPLEKWRLAEKLDAQARRHAHEAQELRERRAVGGSGQAPEGPCECPCVESR